MLANPVRDPPRGPYRSKLSSRSRPHPGGARTHLPRRAPTAKTRPCIDTSSRSRYTSLQRGPYRYKLSSRSRPHPGGARTHLPRRAPTAKTRPCIDTSSRSRYTSLQSPADARRARYVAIHAHQTCSGHAASAESQHSAQNAPARASDAPEASSGTLHPPADETPRTGTPVTVLQAESSHQVQPSAPESSHTASPLHSPARSSRSSRHPYRPPPPAPPAETDASQTSRSSPHESAARRRKPHRRHTIGSSSSAQSPRAHGPTPHPAHTGRLRSSRQTVASYSSVASACASPAMHPQAASSRSGATHPAATSARDA